VYVLRQIFSPRYSCQLRPKAPTTHGCPSDQAVIDERGEAHYVDRDEYTSVEDVTNKVAHEIESKTASEPLDFDGETGEIYEPPTATPTTPTDTEAKLEGKPKAAQVEAPF